MTVHHLLRIGFLFALCCCARLPEALCAETNVRRPNIVYINVDDLGWMDLGCQGSEYYETPHI
ncbi:MAG: sulfatase, partial [Pirellulales bacterium]|nr:sulfatase [Pirellulales bacterium]